jgi:2-keto-4-pentenoate hydratase
MSDIQPWAQVFIEDNRAGNGYAVPWDAIPTIEEAYAVQDAVLDGLAGDRGELAGYKVAVTAQPMQEALGLTEPLGGLIHGGQLRSSGCSLSMADFVAPALEFEVTVRLASDVPTDKGPFDRSSIAPYVGEVMSSFELVDPRGADVATVGAAGLVADRCLSEGAILGAPVTDWSSLDLANCAVELDWNGATIETGVTGAAMGHPFEGLAWVANHMASRGRFLRAGDVVLTGSVFGPKPVAAGDQVTYRISGLGEVSVSVSA